MLSKREAENGFSFGMGIDPIIPNKLHSCMPSYHWTIYLNWGLSLILLKGWLYGSKAAPRLESLQNACERTFCLQNIVCITRAFLNIFVHPALSRQIIAHLDSPFIRLHVSRISNMHRRSSVRTANFPVWGSPVKASFHSGKWSSDRTESEQHLTSSCAFSANFLSVWGRRFTGTKLLQTGQKIGTECTCAG